MASNPSGNDGLQPEAWLRDYGDTLYRFALAKTGRPETAEDLVQETLLAAWRSRARFHGGSSELTWLLGICRHKVLDYYRQSARVETAPSLSDSADEQRFFKASGVWRETPEAWNRDPLTEAETEAFLAVLIQCVNDLPAAQREGFQWCELTNVGVGRASEALDVSVNNLYVLLHRARLRLRRCLEVNWFAGEGPPP